MPDPITVEAIVPASFTANVRKQELKVTDIRSWPAVSLAKVFEYGLQRILNDAAGSVPTKNEDGTDRPAPEVAAECLSVAQKVADNLAAGVIRATAIRIGDPVKAMAFDMAEKAVFTSLREQGKKPAEYDTRKAARDLVESNPAWMAQAALAVEAAKAIAVSIDLSALAPKAKGKA